MKIQELQRIVSRAIVVVSGACAGSAWGVAIGGVPVGMIVGTAVGASIGFAFLRIFMKETQNDNNK